MTLKEAIAVLRRYCGNPNKDEHPDYRFTDSLSAGLQALNRRVMFYGKDDTTTIALTAAVAEYNLPADLVEVTWAAVNLADELQRSDQDEWRRRGIDFRNGPVGQPLEYAHWTNRIILYPCPDAGTVGSFPYLTLRYNAAHPDVIPVSGIERLNQQDQRVPLYFAAAEWWTVHGDPNLAEMKQKMMMAAFETETKKIEEQYGRRYVRR